MAITESDEIKVAMFRPRAVKLKMPDRIRKPSTLRCFQLPFFPVYVILMRFLSARQIFASLLVTLRLFGEKGRNGRSCSGTGHVRRHGTS